MQMRLLFLVEQEMRSLSNIIKYNRINDRGVICLGEVVPKDVQEETPEVEQMIRPEPEQAQQQLVLAEEEAARMLAVAREEAGYIYQQAQSEKEALRLEANAEIEQMKNELEATYTQRLQLLEEKEAANEVALQALRAQLLVDVEDEVVTLMKQLLERIVAKQVYTDGKWLEWIVRKMLYTENVTEAITIYLGSANYHEQKVILAEKMADFPYTLNIEEDRTLAVSMCAVQTAKGRIEYDIQEGLQQVLADISKVQTLSQP